MKTFLAFAAALILGIPLTACGGSDGAQTRKEAARITTYCAAIKDAALDIKSFNPQDPDYKHMQNYFDLMQGLSKKSPPDVQGEWNVVNYDFTEIEKAAAEANVKFSSIPKIIKGKLPKGAKPEKFPALKSAFTYLESVNLQVANQKIATNSAKVCKVDLSPDAF